MHFFNHSVGCINEIFVLKLHVPEFDATNWATAKPCEGTANVSCNTPLLYVFCVSIFCSCVAISLFWPCFKSWRLWPCRWKGRSLTDSKSSGSLARNWLASVDGSKDNTQDWKIFANLMELLDSGPYGEVRKGAKGNELKISEDSEFLDKFANFDINQYPMFLRLGQFFRRSEASQYVSAWGCKIDTINDDNLHDVVFGDFY